MPNSYTELYFPVLAQGLLAVVLAAALIVISYAFGKRVRNKIKDTPYESGIVPTGDARSRFSVKFYLVAMLFILFDIEAIFLYPWVVVFLQLAGIVPSSRWRKWRRPAIVVIVAVAAIITPSSDPFSFLALAIPMLVFYEGSIIVGRALHK